MKPAAGGPGSTRRHVTAPCVRAVGHPRSREMPRLQLARPAGSGPLIEIEYELRGNPSTQPVVLLVCGLGQQLVEWPEDAFIQPLLRSGRAVLAFDNRDCGKSTLLEKIPPSNEVILALKERVPFINLNAGSSHYTLEDMAEDAILLLDGLGINRVHVVGASMGGMIAQLILTAYPERCRSCTIMYSCPGPSNGPHLPTIPFYLQFAAAGKLKSGYDAGLEERVEARIKSKKHTAGVPGVPFDEERMRRETPAHVIRQGPLKPRCCPCLPSA